jgi:uncharacterized protein DUF5994
MTSGPNPTHIPLRLRLKPKAPPTGYVDGAWWPRTRDLISELPGLTEVLAVRLGRIERVAYALSAWDTSPSRLDIDDFRVRLEGFAYQDRNIIHVTGSSRRRISLLVVPPELTDPDGHAAMMTAGHRGNTDRPESILASVPAPRQATEDATDRGQNDGGRPSI